jgi:hypothetical protein
MQELRHRKLETTSEIRLVLEVILKRFRIHASIFLLTQISQSEEDKDTHDWDADCEAELQAFYKEEKDLNRLTPNDLFSAIFSHKGTDNTLLEEEVTMYMLFEYLRNKGTDIFSWYTFENKTLLEVFDFFEVEAVDWDGKIFKFYKLILAGDYETYINEYLGVEEMEDMEPTFIAFRKTENQTLV